ncbi:ParB N-terminal domain-containing protein [Streptomyces sp. NPDC050145]|uniref:ParB N-terminal domain-containing protein n=1 Tax=Streptomyces sp. NPDC050145 TaxID=3365602 RepID=UPI0037A7FCAB
MQATTIPIRDIQTKYPVRESVTPIGELKHSMGRVGMRVPPIVNPANFEIISGERRVRAYRQLRLGSTIRVFFPADVAEARRELGDHAMDPASQECALPMAPREKVNLASRLAELPSPSDVPRRTFSPLSIVAEAIGLTSETLRCVNLTIEKCKEGELNLMPEASRAREALSLMLNVLAEGRGVRDSEARVKQLFDALEQSCGAVGGGPAPKSLRRSMHPSMRKGRLEEFKRGLSQVSGGVEGLLIGLPGCIPDADRSFIEREIKGTRRSLGLLLKELESPHG